MGAFYSTTTDSGAILTEMNVSEISLESFQIIRKLFNFREQFIQIFRKFLKENQVEQEFPFPP